MNLIPVINQLRDEMAQIDRAISMLEELERRGAAVGERPKNRRGRKSMGAAERLEVSARMKRYWAHRRQARKGTSQ